MVIEKVTLAGGNRAAGLERPSTARHPVVPSRTVGLSESMRAQQILKGIYVERDGVKYALPIDSWADRTVWQGAKMWADGPVMPHRIGARAKAPRTDFHKRTLAWLRDNVHQDIPARYYRAVLGHDLHVSTYADLYGKHQHMGWASPFDPGDGSSVRAPLDPTFQTFFRTHWPDSPAGGSGESFGEHWATCRLGAGCPSRERVDVGSRLRLLEEMQGQRGFVENLGWLSGAKVTSAFVSEEIDELVSATGSEYADFDYHEVGTSSTAESNAHTALQTTSGIARATGTPTDADPIYRSVATVTADTSETWQEHGIFNNSTGPAMMDRNLTGGQAVVGSDQVQYTFELTKNPES